MLRFIAESALAIVELTVMLVLTCAPIVALMAFFISQIH